MYLKGKVSVCAATLVAFLLASCGGGHSSTPENSTPPPGPNPSSIDVITYHYDNMRTGQNLRETTLTPGKINPAQFGKLGEFVVDGQVYAQPLYLSNVAIGGAAKNVLYVATEHGSVFAFDANSVSGPTTTPLWKISTQLPGETPSDDHDCDQVTPEIGITSTPVIDRTRGAIYVIAVSKDAGGNYIHRIHALDLASGRELFSGPITITASYPGTGDGSSGGLVIFDPRRYKERASLLEINGTIYTTWASHCDHGPYTSWVMAYSADTLRQTAVLNLVPNGGEGGIWMSGAAPAADPAGNIFFISGNGTFDTTLDSNGFPINGNCGNCFAKISSSAPLRLLDYFTPMNTVADSQADGDFGSGGPLLLPDFTDTAGTVRHLAVGAGKDAKIYVLERDNMGKFDAAQDRVYQEIAGQLGGAEFGKPSYFNNTVYFGAVGDSLKAFPIANARLATSPSSQTQQAFDYPGTTPAISASSPTANGIVWAVETVVIDRAAVLHAYDATDLSKELYNSDQMGDRDQFAGNKFITPMIANGRVYVGTPSSVAVFGPLP